MLSPATRNTKIISVLTILSFIIALVVGGYAISISKDKISEDEFTISQALAHGNQYVMVVFFVLAFIGSLVLTYLRGGPRWSMILRFVSYLVAYGFTITIIWITVAQNKNLHFKFAGTIFTLQFLIVLTITYLFNKYLDCDDNRLVVLDYNLLLILSSFVLLVVFGIFSEDDKSEFRNIIFASNENITVFLNLIPVIFLGFV